MPATTLAEETPPAEQPVPAPSPAPRVPVPGEFPGGRLGADRRFAGASAHLEAWGKKIYFIGGGTTMYRYPDGYRLVTPTIV